MIHAKRKIILNNILTLEKLKQKKSKRNNLNKWFQDNVLSFHMKVTAGELLYQPLNLKNSNEVQNFVNQQFTSDTILSKYLDCIFIYFEHIIKFGATKQFLKNLEEQIANQNKEFKKEDLGDYSLEREIRRSFVSYLLYSFFLIYCEDPDYAKSFQSFFDIWNITFPEHLIKQMRKNKIQKITEDTIINHGPNQIATNIKKRGIVKQQQKNKSKQNQQQNSIDSQSIMQNEYNNEQQLQDNNSTRSFLQMNNNCIQQHNSQFVDVTQNNCRCSFSNKSQLPNTVVNTNHSQNYQENNYEQINLTKNLPFNQNNDHILSYTNHQEKKKENNHLQDDLTKSLPFSDDNFNSSSFVLREQQSQYFNQSDWYSMVVSVNNYEYDFSNKLQLPNTLVNTNHLENYQQNNYKQVNLTKNLSFNQNNVFNEQQQQSQSSERFYQPDEYTMVVSANNLEYLCSKQNTLINTNHQENYKQNNYSQVDLTKSLPFDLDNDNDNSYTNLILDDLINNKSFNYDNDNDVSYVFSEEEQQSQSRQYFNQSDQYTMGVSANNFEYLSSKSHTQINTNNHYNFSTQLESEEYSHLNQLIL